jgi:hypothetical protein
LLSVFLNLAARDNRRGARRTRGRRHPRQITKAAAALSLIAAADIKPDSENTVQDINKALKSEKNKN